MNDSIVATITKFYIWNKKVSQRSVQTPGYPGIAGYPGVSRYPGVFGYPGVSGYPHIIYAQIYRSIKGQRHEYKNKYG